MTDVLSYIAISVGPLTILISLAALVREEYRLHKSQNRRNA